MDDIAKIFVMTLRKIALRIFIPLAIIALILMGILFFDYYLLHQTIPQALAPHITYYFAGFCMVVMIGVLVYHAYLSYKTNHPTQKLAKTFLFIGSYSLVISAIFTYALCYGGEFLFGSHYRFISASSDIKHESAYLYSAVGIFSGNCLYIRPHFSLIMTQQTCSGITDKIKQMRYKEDGYKVEFFDESGQRISP